MTTVIVRHRVADFEAWSTVFAEHGTVRTSHGVTATDVLRTAGDADEVTIVMQYPNVDQARAFLGDPSLKEAMGRAGVVGEPDIRVLEAATVANGAGA